MSTADRHGVSAVLVTRGDQPLAPVVATFTPDLFDEVIVFNNHPAAHHAADLVADTEAAAHVPVVWANVGAVDLRVYGRYAAMRCVPGGAVAYVQDDDATLPHASLAAIVAAYQPGVLVANMPAPFRAHYTDSCLIGFGAIFDANLPALAFDRFLPVVTAAAENEPEERGFAAAFLRCCDVVFTALTPATWVDVPYSNLPYATGEDRMYRQPEHVGERARVLRLARGVRDV